MNKNDPAYDGLINPEYPDRASVADRVQDPVVVQPVANVVGGGFADEGVDAVAGGLTVLQLPVDLGQGLLHLDLVDLVTFGLHVKQEVDHGDVPLGRVLLQVQEAGIEFADRRGQFLLQPVRVHQAPGVAPGGGTPRLTLFHRGRDTRGRLFECRRVAPQFFFGGPGGGYLIPQLIETSLNYYESGHNLIEPPQDRPLLALISGLSYYPVGMFSKKCLVISDGIY